MSVCCSGGKISSKSMRDFLSSIVVAVCQFLSLTTLLKSNLFMLDETTMDAR